MNMLSGGNTPLESMPAFLQAVMQASPVDAFRSLPQAILYRGAGIELVWPHFLAVAVVGCLFFLLSVWRFRRITATAVTSALDLTRQPLKFDDTGNHATPQSMLAGRRVREVQVAATVGETAETVGRLTRDFS